MDVSKSPPHLPENMTELTAEWLSAALACSYPGVEVTSMHYGTVIHGTNTKIRLLLTYNEAGHSYRLPPTMLVKCGFEAHSAQLTQITRSEVVFYRNRAPELDDAVNVPKCYFAALDENSGTSILLLEDLLARNVTFGSAVRPIDPKIAQRALGMLAHYHARWWNSQDLASLGTPIFANEWLDLTLEAGNFEHCMQLPRFEYVPPELRDREHFRRALYSSWESNAQGPSCLLHGDLHLGNCFFEVDGTPGFLDWQGDTRGCWAHDFTEFVLTTLDIDARRNCERPLLEFYLQQLGSHGIDAPSFDNAWKQYRRNAIWVAASALCPETMQPETVCIAYTQRGMAAVVDLDALASFDE